MPGFPSPADDFIDDAINLHELVVHNPPAIFLYRATGWSMILAGVCDGHILVVDRSVTPKSGDIVRAFAPGVEVYSIDESFFIVPKGKGIRIEAKCQALRARIQRGTTRAHRNDVTYGQHQYPFWTWQHWPCSNRLARNTTMAGVVRACVTQLHHHRSCEFTRC